MNQLASLRPSEFALPALVSSADNRAQLRFLGRIGAEADRVPRAKAQRRLMRSTLPERISVAVQRVIPSLHKFTVAPPT
jgi:hypothetical protein